MHLERILLFYLNPCFYTSMHHSIFIHFSKMTVTKITVQFVANLTNSIYKSEYFLFSFHPFCDSCAFLRQSVFSFCASGWS